MFVTLTLEASSATLAFLRNYYFQLAHSVSDLLLYFDLLLDPSIICSSTTFHNKI